MTQFLVCDSDWRNTIQHNQQTVRGGAEWIDGTSSTCSNSTWSREWERARDTMNSNYDEWKWRVCLMDLSMWWVMRRLCHLPYLHTSAMIRFCGEKTLALNRSRSRSQPRTSESLACVSVWDKRRRNSSLMFHNIHTLAKTSSLVAMQHTPYKRAPEYPERPSIVRRISVLWKKNLLLEHFPSSVRFVKWNGKNFHWKINICKWFP